MSFSHLSRSSGHGASTASVYFLKANARLGFADVLLGKLKKYISFALRRGTIAQVTTHALDGYAWPARRRGELALNMAGWHR
jgi:hypothetical protein